MQGSRRLQHYHAFGLKIASQLALPELHPGTGPADAEISIQRVVPSEPSENSAWGSGRTIELRLESIHFTVSGGRRIDIVAPHDVGEADVRVWLLGTVMAALLHQRGYLPIHANVVALPGAAAAAFAGDSGAGKSTLAAWMEARGHGVLTDDLCAIRLDAAAVPSVFHGIPRMKLWADTLDRFGRDRASLEKVASDLDKYHVPLGAASAEGSLEPLRLERIYVLDRAGEREPFAIARLTGGEAAAAVLANAFRWGLGQMIHGEPRAQFDQCMALAQKAALFSVRRQWGMERFDEQARLIERHLTTPLDELRS